MFLVDSWSGAATATASPSWTLPRLRREDPDLVMAAPPSPSASPSGPRQRPLCFRPWPRSVFHGRGVIRSVSFGVRPLSLSHRVSKARSRCTSALLLFRCAGRLCSVHPVTRRWALGCSHLWAIVNDHAAVNSHTRVLAWPCFHSPGQILAVGLLGPTVTVELTEDLSRCPPQQLRCVAFSPAVPEGSGFFMFMPILTVCFFGYSLLQNHFNRYYIFNYAHTNPVSLYIRAPQRRETEAPSG